MSKSPEHISKMDWRLQHVTWTTAPFADPLTKAVVPSESPVVPVALIKHGEDKLGAALPNATALFLSLSFKSHVEAGELLRKCVQDKDQFGKVPDDEAFTFFEVMMGSAVFACTALEAFANEEIPDDFVYVDSSDQRFTRTFDKQQIERQLNLDTKIGDIVPRIFGIKFPKGGKLWAAFLRLRKLRDRIIHMKTKDRQFSGEQPNSIWNALMSDPLPETYSTAKGIVNFFFEAKGSPPRWFEKCPF